MTSDIATQYTQITVDRDPTIWTLKNPISDPAEITKSTAPLALAVSRPLDGILLLSVKAAAFVTLFPARSGPLSVTQTGWIYDDMPQPGIFLYLPAVSIPAATGPVLYPTITPMPELQNTIMTAMASSQKVPVGVEVAGGIGQVVVNGAELPFVVIVPT